jgi:hypothetical protein
MGDPATVAFVLEALHRLEYLERKLAALPEDAVKGHKVKMPGRSEDWRLGRYNFYTGLGELRFCTEPVIRS